MALVIPKRPKRAFHYGKLLLKPNTKQEWDFFSRPTAEPSIPEDLTPPRHSKDMSCSSEQKSLFRILFSNGLVPIH